MSARLTTVEIIQMLCDHSKSSAGLDSTINLEVRDCYHSRVQLTYLPVRTHIAVGLADHLLERLRNGLGNTKRTSGVLISEVVTLILQPMHPCTAGTGSRYHDMML